jgi:ureidoacrylate peracid hydrolase
MELLLEMKEIVNPRHTALLIVDPQDDFCSPHSPLVAKTGMDMSRIEAAVPRLNNFITACRKAGILVIWIREIYAGNKMLANQRAQHFGRDNIWLINEKGQGIKWYPKMISPEESEPVITKWNYDAFADTDLDLLLRAKGIKTLLMTGFHTNVCVETTARHGFIKGYYIVVVSDCTDAPTSKEYEGTMLNIAKYFGKVAASDEVIALW